MQLTPFTLLLSKLAGSVTLESQFVTFLDRSFTPKSYSNNPRTFEDQFNKELISNYQLFYIVKERPVVKTRKQHPQSSRTFFSNLS